MVDSLIAEDAVQKTTDRCRDCGRLIFDRGKSVRPHETINGKLYCKNCADNHRDEAINIEKMSKSFPKRLGSTR